MESVQQQNKLAYLNVPDSNQQKEGKLTKVAFQDLLLDIGRGTHTVYSSLQGDNSDALHPSVIAQIRDLLATANLTIKTDKDIDNALLLGAAPYYWKSSPSELVQNQQNMLIGMPPKHFAGPGMDWVVSIQIPYETKQLYNLAPIFWKDRPELELRMVCALPIKNQQQYYNCLWDFEGIKGLERISSGVSFDYNHAWVWTCIVIGNWHSLEQMAHLVKICDVEEPKSSWLSKQVEALRPPLSRAFRIWQRRLAPTTIFSNLYEEKGFPNFSKEPLPAVQSLLEDCPKDIFAYILSFLDIDDISNLILTSRRLNAIIGGACEGYQAIWQPILQHSHPELCGISLANHREWAEIYKENQGMELLKQLLHHCDQDNLKKSKVLKGWFLDRLDVLEARAWVGSNSRDALITRAKRLLLHELWAQIAVEGALLQPAAKHLWWATVGKEIKIKCLYEITSRMKTDSYPSLLRGIYERSDKPKLETKIFYIPTLESKNAGIALLLLPQFDLYDAGYDPMEEQLKLWFCEQAKESSPTKAIQSMITTLYQFLDCPPKMSDCWTQLFGDALAVKNEVMETFRDDILNVLRRLLPSNKYYREIEKPEN